MIEKAVLSTDAAFSFALFLLTKQTSLLRKAARLNIV
jgi:hypothetical protein